jgi:hypothetical protein
VDTILKYVRRYKYRTLYPGCREFFSIYDRVMRRRSELAEGD